MEVTLRLGLRTSSYKVGGIAVLYPHSTVTIPLLCPYLNGVSMESVWSWYGVSMESHGQ